MDAGRHVSRTAAQRVNMNTRTEGTVILDGLIEGPLPDEPDAGRLLHDWVRSASDTGIPLNLETEGGSFSILADNRPFAARELGPDPAAALAESINGLLELFPPEQRRQLFSTLRSIEVVEGAEVQTVYSIGSDGRVNTHSRTIEADTEPPTAPLSRNEIVRRCLIGLGVAALILIVSALFVDYRALTRRLIDSVLPVDAERIEIDNTVFEQYFTVKADAVVSGGSSLRIVIERTERFPVSNEELDRMHRAADTVHEKLMIEALARGYVRAEYFDAEGKHLGRVEIRIAGLRKNESAKPTISLPSTRPKRMAVTY